MQKPQFLEPISPDVYLKKAVIVKTEVCRLAGILRGHTCWDREKHVPQCLIVEGEGTTHIVRAWQCVGVK